MKKIIFLVFISISSHALVTCDYNSAVDKLNTSSLSTGQCKELSTPVDVLYDGSCGDNLLVKYYGPLYTNYCTDSTLVQHTKYNIQIYSVQHNYTGCLSGQEIINGACATSPTCPSGQAWNSSTDTCESTDSDSDGIPDKCDIDFVNVATSDCDGDGLANNSDSDIDGDGVPNSTDANSLDSTNTGTCYVNTLSRSYATQEQCYLGSSSFLNPDGGVSYYSEVSWDNCRNACYYKQKSCPRDQAIKNGECRSVEPDISQCSGTSSCKVMGLGVGTSQQCFKTCYCLTTSSPVPTSTNEYFYEEVSCADGLTDKEKLNDLKDSSDINTSVNKLDINGTANLDSAASFKAALDSYAGSKESTALEQLKELGIQSLQAVQTNTNLDKLNSTLENFSAVSTSNDGIIDGTLKGIKSGIDTGLAVSNEFLEGIKDNTDKLLNNLEGKNSDGSNVDTSSLDSSFAGVDGLISDVQSGFSNISNSFTSLTSNINQGFNYSISGGGSVATTVNVFGKTVTLDPSQALIAIAPVIYYITYITFFLLAIKIIFLGFMVV